MDLLRQSIYGQQKQSAYNGHFESTCYLWRRLVLPRKIKNWLLTSLQQRLVKTGGRLVKHARHF
jgi:hypothetical protein